MKIINPSFELINPPAYQAVLNVIELAGRTCYKSESKGNPEAFVRGIVKRGHESVIEHASLTAKIICDRGIMAELTRHRLCAFSIESSRYCNYSKGKFEGGISVIKPFFWDEDSEEYAVWKLSMQGAEHDYLELIEFGATPEQARSVLPNSLATTIIMTCNLREWRHILTLRLSKKAHPQMREIMTIAYSELIDRYPVFFEDVGGGE